MATKAERFRYAVERSGGPKPQPKKLRNKKRAGTISAQAPPRGRKAVVAFEETPPGVPPSRKSTRQSKNRQKGAVPLTGRTLLSKSTPEARHGLGPARLRAPR
jgi:hypothetical protein